MKNLFVLLLMLPLLVVAQEEGAHFEHGLNWQQVKEKAKKENKYLFVDCFTTWCGPCKYMTSTIFPQEKVGTFMNKNFVNLKIQMDKTKDDSEEVKSWYADADAIAKEYSVKAYPTYLIFAPNGDIVHRMVGSDEADSFIARLGESLDPDKQYYTLLRKYEAGNKEPEFLRRVALAANSSYDQATASKISEEYLNTQQDLFTKENLEFLGEFTRSSTSKGFQLMLNEPEKVDAVLGKGKAADKVASIILREEVFSKVNPKTTTNLDSFKTVIKEKYPKINVDKQLAMAEIQLMQYRKDWNAFQPAIRSYMQQYGSEVKPEQLNSFAWAVFENCEDPDCVVEALAWSKRSIDETEEKSPAFLDTYANLLYKTGKTDEALVWQQKAVDLASEGEKTALRTTLEKMKKGEKTWREAD
ncbi:thioredoxin family protein [Olivibacter ginsenosidimutans]